MREFTDIVLILLAAWMLLAGVSYWSHRQELGLSRAMLIASVRAPLQLLLLAFVLHWLFDIHSHWAQAGVISVFCLLAGYTAAGHHAHFKLAWIAASAGLIASCLLTLPWLVLTGAIHDNARTLIPMGSMVAANSMNAVAIMFDRLCSTSTNEAVVSMKDGLRTAMISNINMLKVVGVVHMPGIFVGMILAGSTVLAAASAQLVVLYMIVASSFSACVVSFFVLNYWHNRIPVSGVNE